MLGRPRRREGSTHDVMVEPSGISGISCTPASISSPSQFSLSLDFSLYGQELFRARKWTAPGSVAAQSSSSEHTHIHRHSPFSKSLSLAHHVGFLRETPRKNKHTRLLLCRRSCLPETAISPWIDRSVNCLRKPASRRLVITSFKNRK